MKEQPAALFSKRIAIIDGFRGLAILLVIGYHYTSWCFFGWTGVDLFFVLSGLLITGKLLESAGKKNYLLQFFSRRILRIIPLYGVLLTFFFLAMPLLQPSLVSASVAELLHVQLYYWTFTVNIYDAMHGWPSNISLVPLWSLACEMQFYLVWPFVMLAIAGQKKHIIVLFFAACIVFAFLFRLYGSHVLFSGNIYRYTLLPSRLDAFACGACLAVCLERGWYLPVLRKGWVLAVAAFFAIVITVIQKGSLWHLGSSPENVFGYTLNAFCWTGLIGWALPDGGSIANLFASKWLTLAGKYSYAMYLFHVPVKVALEKWLVNRLPAAMIPVLALMITIATAVLSYQLIEKRFLQIKIGIAKQPQAA